MGEISAMLVSDRVLAQIGLRAMLQQCDEITLLEVARTTSEAVEMAVRLRPSVVIIDTMGDDDVLAAIASLVRRCQPAPGVLILASRISGAVLTAVQAGGNGLILAQSGPQELIAALRLAAAGYRLIAPPRPRRAPAANPRHPTAWPDCMRLERLTDREFEVLQLVARGFCNAEICDAFNLSESTVKSHIRSILGKLGLRNRVHTVIYAYEMGFVRVGVSPLIHHAGHGAAASRARLGRSRPALTSVLEGAPGG
jgi:DNA-binding NarL/FixJ family response regulator